MKKLTTLLAASAMLLSSYCQLQADEPTTAACEETPSVATCYEDCRTATYTAPAIAIGAVAIVAIIAVTVQNANSGHGHSHSF